MDKDMDLDALLSEAAAERVEPSAALRARILADADAMQPQPFVINAVSVPKTGGIAGWFAGLAAGLGGARAVAGLSLAGLTGLFVGVVEPAALQSLTALLTGEAVQIDRMDLLPATSTIWTEN